MEIFINLLQAAISVVTTSMTFGLLYWLWIFFEKYVLIFLRKFLPHHVIMLLDNCGPLPLSHHWVQEFFIILVMVPAHILEVMITKPIRFLLCLCKTLVLSGKNGIQSLWTSLSHSLIVCFHSIRCLPILQDFFSFRGFHSFKRFLTRLLMFSREQSFIAVPLTLLFLTTMFGSVDLAPLSKCAPACYTDPDRYCTLFSGSSECRECRLTCGNRNHQEECLQHCKGSQYFPGMPTTSPEEFVSTTSSDSPSSTVSVGMQRELYTSAPRFMSTIANTNSAVEVATTGNSEVPAKLLMVIVTFMVLFVLLSFFAVLWYCGVLRKLLSVFCSQDAKSLMSSSPQDADLTTDIPLLDRSQPGGQQQTDVLSSNGSQPAGQQQQADHLPYQTASTRESAPVHPSDQQSDCGNEEEEAQTGEPSGHTQRKGTAKPDVGNQPFSPCDDGDVDKTRLALSDDSSRPPQEVAVDDMQSI